MPIESEKEVAAYLQKTNKTLYDRLFLNRTIAGKITAVSGTRPLWLVRLDTTGDAWHACYEPGYTPSIGDTVDLTWRDADTGYVMTPRNAGALTATFAPIGNNPTLITGTATASVTLAGIPQTFQNLKLLITGQTTNATAVFINCQLSGDTGNNYYGGYGGWLAAAITPVQNAGIGVLNVGILAASASLNVGSNEITFYDYANVTKRPSMTFISHAVETGATGNFLTVNGGGEWATSGLPITSIKVFPATGNWADGSKIWLYGM